MKKIFYISIIFLIHSMAHSQTERSSYPIIFVHGLTSNYKTWFEDGENNDIYDYLTNEGYIDGGNINILLDAVRSTNTLMNTKEEDVVSLNSPLPGDLYTVNFEVHASGLVIADNPDIPNSPGITGFEVDETSTSFVIGIPAQIPTGMYNVDDIIRIDNEFMLITGVNDISLNVIRAILGSTASTHISGSKVWNLSTQGNQASISKQGWGLKKAIDLVKTANNKEKVILVGHSMGGLAAREYIRSSYYENDIAKLVTIGTPHLGSTADDMNDWLTVNQELDPRSDGMRDLRYTYGSESGNPDPPFGNIPDDGIFLFGGPENYSLIPENFYYSTDFNADGDEDDMINGLSYNLSTLPQGLDYTWIVSDLAWPVDGDWCVRWQRQFPWEEYEAGTENPLIEVGDTLMTSTKHGDETTDYYSLIRGLDEPDSYELAYELFFDKSINGFITYQPYAQPIDNDYFKIFIESSCGFSATIDGYDSGISSLAVLDENQTILSESGTGSLPLTLKVQVEPGIYYIRVRGAATNESWLNSYNLSLSSECIYPVWCPFPDFESEGEPLGGEYVFTMDVFNEVPAYLNSASNGGWDDGASFYQCTEYVARYLNTIYGTDYTDIKDLEAPTQGFQGFDFHPGYTYNTNVPNPRIDFNGNIIKLKNIDIPSPGSIHINNDFGHSAIVKNVNGDEVTLIEQNWIWNDNGTYKYTTERKISVNTINLYFYEFNHTGRFEGDIWADDGSSQAIFDCYIRNGDAEILGFPFDNGGSIFVHDYYFTASDQEIHVQLQDFYSDNSGQTTICYLLGENDAYLLKGCIGYLWWEYQDLLGAPISDEIDDIAQFPEKERNDGFDIMQNFQFGHSFWDQETGLIRINCYRGTCEEDGIAVCLPSSPNTVLRYDRLKAEDDEQTCEELQAGLYAPNLSRVEYFWDTDPGFGSGIEIPITPDDVVNVQTNISVASLSLGLHRLYIRALDETGNWGIPQAKSVLVQATGNDDPKPNVTQVEYFFDADPDVGNGTSFSFSQDTLVEISENIDVSSLNLGLHRLYIRAQDEHGNWGIPQAKSVLVQSTGMNDPLPNITNVEYFFDQDPDAGNGTSFTIAPDDSIAISENIDVSGLNLGLHRLYIRGQDESGNWGIPQAKSVLVQRTGINDPLPNIVEIEYFYDEEPGFGSGYDFQFTPDTLVEVDTNLPCDTLALGDHICYVRAKDAAGYWGIPQYHEFTIEEEKLPDLIVQSVDAPSSASQGQSISVTVNLENQGEENLSQAEDVLLRVVLSADADITVDDILFADVRIDTSRLRAGATTSEVITMHLPGNISGAYYIGAYVDAAFAHEESDENNNANYDTEQITIQSVVTSEATSGFDMPMVFNPDNYGFRFDTHADYGDDWVYHPGVDLNGPGGAFDDDDDPVYAIANGKVKFVNINEWGGIVIEHIYKGQAVYSQYGHVDKAYVNVDDVVSKGTEIAEVGAVGEGDMTPHLHFEIRESDHPARTNGSYWSWTLFKSHENINEWYDDPEKFVYSFGPYSVTTQTNWTFGTENDWEGWSPRNADFGYEALNGRLIMTPKDDEFDASIVSPPLDNISGINTIEIHMASQCSDGDLEVFFANHKFEFSEEKKASTEIISDGQYRTYSLRLDAVPAWTGTITALRIDPSKVGDANIGFDWIRLYQESVMPVISGDPPSTEFVGTQITMDFENSPGGEVTVHEFLEYPPENGPANSASTEMFNFNDVDAIGTSQKSPFLKPRSKELKIDKKFQPTSKSNSAPNFIADNPQSVILANGEDIITVKRYWEISSDMADGTYTTVLKIAYDVNDFPPELTEEEATILYYDSNLSQYVSLPTNRDTENDTLWTQEYLDHFGLFAIGKPGYHITDLRASVQDENILLEWSPVDGVSGFNVYRGTQYDFEPDLLNGSNRIAQGISDEDAGTDGVQWTDTGNGADVLGDIHNHYFYRVTAVSSIESVPSNVAGEFDYNLITTDGTDINRLVVLMNTDNTRNPITSAEELAQAIPYCTDVYLWDADGQGTIGHVKGVPFNNFDIQPGYPYTISLTNDTVWTVAGSYSDVSFNLVTTEGTDINRIGVPLAKSNLTTAEELGQDIPNCTDVYYWDAEGQGTLGHVVGVPFNNFEVKAGHHYSISITAPTIWPDYGGGTELLASTQEQTNLKTEKSLLGGIPHTVYGEIVTSTNMTQQMENLNIRAKITSRPNEILTEQNFGVGTDGKYWWISVSNFATAWEIGDSLCVEVVAGENEKRGTTIVALSDRGSDNAGEILLKTITYVAGVDVGQIPNEFVLLPNYPNPFNPETKITYGLPKIGQVTIQIFNISGQLVRTLVDGVEAAGYHHVTWNGLDNYGRFVGSGIYFCRMMGADFMNTKKLIITK